MRRKVCIIDGYVDEPANLGVPPYVSTYPRYIAGASLLSGAEVSYITIDSLRRERQLDFINTFDIVIVISGITVPGHYVGGTPISLFEINRIGNECPIPLKILCGPIHFGYTLHGGTKAIYTKPEGFDHILSYDPEYFIYGLLSTGKGKDVFRDYTFLKKVAVAGAEILPQHPNFPFVISEIELSRGCDRGTYCSFCTEPLYGEMQSRPPEDIIEEMKALYKVGGKYFRLGRQSNVFAYGAEKKNGELIPQVESLSNLLQEIHEVMPDIKTLHFDNANPISISHYPEISQRMLETIVKYDTPADVISFGIESFDKRVIKENNIGKDPEEMIEAIKMVNEIGNRRIDGIPKLLPGVNLLYGLIGETGETYEINLNYLKKILHMGLLLRRINIRRVIYFKDTFLGRYIRQHKLYIDRKLFEHYKYRIREEIDRKMLKKVFPIGAVLHGVISEYHDGNITFGRQLASYPILVGIPIKLPLRCEYNVVITGHGKRSVSGIPYPIRVNSLPIKALAALPKIGIKRAKRITTNRPIKSMKDLEDILEDKIDLRIRDKLSFL